MAKSPRKGSLILDVVSIGMVILAILGAAVRFGPDRTKRQASNLYLLASGDVQGCTFRDFWSPLDADLQDAGVELLGQIKPIGEDGPLAHWDTPFGDFWTPPGNDLLVLLAEYAVDVYGAESPLFHKGDVVMDFGANIGTFSRRAFEAGASKVIAVEPSPLNVQALARNFAKEIEEGRFVLVPKAVWNEPGEMTLNIYELSVLDSLVMDERHEAPLKTQVPVELVTIDSLVEELGLERVDFIKMDIEGAERQALQGAAETLRRFRPRMAIAAENLLDDVEAVPAAVAAAVPGYQVEYGRCLNIRPGTMRPEAIRFTPPGLVSAAD